MKRKQIKHLRLRDLIKTVADRWKSHYLREGGWYVGGGDKSVIYEDLLKLDLETASSKDVADVIGNDSWTNLECCHCSAYVDEVIFLNGVASSEYGGSMFCRVCISDAYQVFV